MGIYGRGMQGKGTVFSAYIQKVSADLALFLSLFLFCGIRDHLLLTIIIMYDKNRYILINAKENNKCRMKM